MIMGDSVTRRPDTDRTLSEAWHPLESLPEQFDREKCSVMAMSMSPGSRDMACIWTPGQKVAGRARLVPIEPPLNIPAADTSPN